MKVVDLNKKPNQSAVEVLEDTLEKVKSGEVVDVRVAWVDKKGSIGGDGSAGDNTILMWASIEHSARSFYYDFINPGEDK